jgi:nicotinic acid mononucleotide adenylyltransferase
VNKRSYAAVQLATEKLSLQLRLPHKEQDRLGVLVMSGSFNPVHTQHIRALESARTAMERAGFVVAGGFLAPSSDGYTDRKVQMGSLSVSERTELCGLATKDSDWLGVFSYGEFSTYRACAQICREIERQCAAHLEGRLITGIEVLGSDTLIRILARVIAEWHATPRLGRRPWYRERIICCVVRPGPESGLEIDYISRALMPQTPEIGITIMLVESRAYGHPLADVSSTKIRELIRSHSWDVLEAHQWLHPEVLSALRTRIQVNESQE